MLRRGVLPFIPCSQKHTPVYLKPSLGLTKRTIKLRQGCFVKASPEWYGKGSAFLKVWIDLLIPKLRPFLFAIKLHRKTLDKRITIKKTMPMRKSSIVSLYCISWPLVCCDIGLDHVYNPCCCSPRSPCDITSNHTDTTLQLHLL